jgi:hypothetical protein
MRFHKDIYFPIDDNIDLNNLIQSLNIKKFKFSVHSIDRIIEKSNIESIGLYLKDLKLEYSTMFEYYKIDNILEKLVFRLNFDVNKDLILVLNKDKFIVTIYFNNKSDNHKTLNKENYITI